MINQRQLVNKLLSALMAALLISIAVPAGVYAQLAQQDRGRLFTPFYDPGAAAGCANDTVDLVGNDNLEKIYNFFVGKGLTPAQAAGITGNADVESSGGDPLIVSPSGYRGIFQWDKASRWPSLVNWTTGKGLDPETLEGQLSFTWHEATQRKNISGIQQYDDYPHTAWYWGRYFEVAIIGGSTSDTPLTNVQHLDKRTSSAKAILDNYGGGGSSSSPTQANCLGGNGQDTQYIDGFTVYSQYDPAWKDLPYSSSTIGESGCGPAAMAMIITNLTDQAVTPVEAANYAARLNLYAPGVGSSWNIGPQLAEHWGLKHEPVLRDVAAITAALRAGKLVITPGQGPKPFTSGGHFIVIRGITADGKFRVGDSGHSDTSDKDWDPQFIVSNMRDGGSYAISK